MSTDQPASDASGASAADPEAVEDLVDDITAPTYEAAHTVAQALRFSEEQALIIEGTTPLGDALAAILENDQVCAVVVLGSHVYGILTPSTAWEAALASAGGRPLSAWLEETTAAECVNSWSPLQPGDDLAQALAALETTEAVGVQTTEGEPRSLTYRDLLSFYGEKTQSIFHIERVEISLRGLAELLVPFDKVQEAIARAQAAESVSPMADSDELKFADLSLGGLIAVFVNRSNYEEFFGCLGKRTYFAGLITGLNETRNDIFHFRSASAAESGRVRLSRAAKLLDMLLRRERMRAEG